ncbi:MAG: ferritin family protein [Nanoarchaeota archaeon]|nr:ferritin family protein [Nanoarchaeota archaeon]
MEFKEALQKAIEFEQKGRMIYEEAAGKTKNDAVAKLFEYLAEQEKMHEDWIRKYVDDQGIELPENSKEDTKEFFKTTIGAFKEKIALSGDDISAYEQGMQLETESYEYYKEHSEKAEDPTVKAFLKFLMEQEQIHYDLLEQSKDYLSDPDLFFQRHEGWMFEG